MLSDAWDFSQHLQMKRRICVFFFWVVVTSACALPAVWFFATGKAGAFVDLGAGCFVSCVLLISIGYFFSGLQYYVTLKKMGCLINKLDVVLFPYMQSFWGIVVPFQGTTLFAATYLGLKYKFKVVSSAVMIVFLYMLNFVFGGIAGIWCAVYQGQIWSLLFWFSVFSVGMPLYVYFAYLFVERRGVPSFVPKKIQVVLKDGVGSLNKLIIDWRNVLVLIVCQVSRQFSYCCIFVILAKSMTSEGGWLWGYLVAVSQELSVVIKFTPGNMGVAEAVAGMVSGLTNVPLASGIAVSFTLTIVQMVVCLILGGVGSLVRLYGAGVASRIFAGRR